MRQRSEEGVRRVNMQRTMSTDEGRRNFSSAKARLNMQTTPSPDPYIIDPVYKEDLNNLVKNDRNSVHNSMGKQNVQQDAERDRIAKAVNRSSKDILDPISKKPI